MPTQNVRAFHDRRRLHAPADQVWTWYAFTFLTNFTFSPLGPSSIVVTLHFTRLACPDFESQYWTYCDDLVSISNFCRDPSLSRSRQPIHLQHKRLSLVP